MSAADKLVFANYDGVGGPPTIDGFAMIDTGVITSEIEAGYINGGRMVLGNSSGLPPVVIQAIRDPANGGTIVLAISCRGDTSFDDIDGVVIGLRPNGGSSAGRQRKIHVFPVWGDAPDDLDPMNLGIGYGAADPLMGNPNAHDAAGPDVPQYQIRKNKKPRSGPSYFGRDNPGDPWLPINPTGETNTSLFHVRARSWVPPVMGMPPFEAAWSIEVRVPTSNAVAGGTNWLDLADDFGLFVDVIRGGRQVNADDANVGEYFAVHYVFPIGAPDLGSVTPSSDIPSSSFGHGLMNAAAANGEGVRFKGGALGIGRRPTSNPAAPLTGEIRVDQPNTMVALLENTGPAAGKVTAQVYVAQFGLNGPGDWTPHWVQPSGLENPSSPQITVPGGTMGTPGTAETTNDWVVGAADTAFYTANSHQCVWIQLDSADNNVTFAQSSVRRNMDFAGFSAITRDVTISGEGYPDPADGSGEHEFVLFTRCRKLIVSELVKNAPHIDPMTITLVNGALMHDAREKMASPFDKKYSTAGNQPQYQDTVVYLWITEGFRRTGKTIEINGTKAELLDGTPGDFGICARHQGVDDPMNWAFSGGGMVQHAPGVYGIRVPHKGKVQVKLRLAAGRDEKPGDRSELPKKPRKPIGEGENGNGNGNDPGTGGGLPKGCLAALLGIFGKQA